MIFKELWLMLMELGLKQINQIFEIEFDLELIL